MTLIVVPPLADLTTRLVVGPGDHLLDLNERFIARVSDPMALSALAATLDRANAPAGPASGDPLPPAQRCLLALAAADALSTPDVLGGPVDALTRLQALGAAIRAVSAGDPGLTAAVDDIILRQGSTQSSVSVALAASRSRLFDPELADPELADPGLTDPGLTDPVLTDLVALELVRPGLVATEPVEIAVDVEQQLPAAFALVARLRPRKDVVLAGRFVAAHREALSRVPALSGVRFSERIRPRTMRAGFGPAGGAGPVPGGERHPSAEPVWAAELHEVPVQGSWAGWLDAGQALRVSGPQWSRCVGVVVSAAGPTSGVRPGPARLRLSGLLPRLAEWMPVALELIVGDPNAPAFTLDAPWWRPWGDRVRLAGLRPYRRPVSPGRPVPGTDGIDDLARWVGEPSDARPLPAAVDRYDVFPGRLAGALFAPEPRTAVLDGYIWDPAVRPVRLRFLSPDGGGPGDFLVSLRTGRLSRIPPSLGRLVSELRAWGSAGLAAELPEGRRGPALAGLCRSGLLRRVSAA